MMERKYSGHIDPNVRMQLNEIQTKGRPNLYIELIDLYLPAANKYSAELRAQVINPKADVYKEIAHAWKSSSYSVGASGLGDLCVQLEETDESAIELIAVLIQNIQTELSFVKTELVQIKIFLAS